MGGFPSISMLNNTTLCVNTPHFLFPSDKEDVCVHTIDYCSVMRKTGICESIWMDLEGSMLSELSQTEKDKYCMISLNGEI